MLGYVCILNGFMKISVIGLGKPGAPLAAVLASKGFPVIGSDLNPAFVESINDGRAPVDEPRLQELISDNRDRRARCLSDLRNGLQSAVSSPSE